MALAHFLTHRRSQSFSPNPLFDVAWYGEQHANEAARPGSIRAFPPGGHQRDIDPSPDFDAGAYRSAISAGQPASANSCGLTATTRWCIIFGPLIA